MALPVLTRLYRRLGRFYPPVFLAVELQSAFVIAAATLGLFSFYYDASFTDYIEILAVAMVLTGIAVGITIVRTAPLMRPISEWIGGSRDEQQSLEAWSAAVGLPLGLIRRDVAVPIIVTIIPTCIWAVVATDLPWVAFVPLFVGSLVALGYSAILHYLILEAGMRPVLIDINRSLPMPRLSAAASAIPLRVRMMTALPLINLITGLVVAAFTSGGGGGAALGLDVLVAVAVATTISLELTVLFSKSILRPIADLRRATRAVGEGRYDVSVPVTTGDELGELAASFNQMVEGLAERERIREAFGTYLDKSRSPSTSSARGSRRRASRSRSRCWSATSATSRRSRRRRRRRRWWRGSTSCSRSWSRSSLATAATSTSSSATGCWRCSEPPRATPTTPTAPCAPPARSRPG